MAQVEVVVVAVVLVVIVAFGSFGQHHGAHPRDGAPEQLIVQSRGELAGQMHHNTPSCQKVSPLSISSAQPFRLSSRAAAAATRTSTTLHLMSFGPSTTDLKPSCQLDPSWLSVASHAIYFWQLRYQQSACISDPQPKWEFLCCPASSLSQ